MSIKTLYFYMITNIFSFTSRIIWERFVQLTEKKQKVNNEKTLNKIKNEYIFCILEIIKKNKKYLSKRLTF